MISNAMAAYDLCVYKRRGRLAHFILAQAKLNRCRYTLQIHLAHVPSALRVSEQQAIAVSSTSTLSFRGLDLKLQMATEKTLKAVRHFT